MSALGVALTWAFMALAAFAALSAGALARTRNELEAEPAVGTIDAREAPHSSPRQYAPLRTSPSMAGMQSTMTARRKAAVQRHEAFLQRREAILQS